MQAPAFPPAGLPRVLVFLLLATALFGIGATEERPAPAQEPVGVLLPSAPDALETEGTPVPSLDRIREHLEIGDGARALFVAEQYVRGAPAGRGRDAAWMAIGVLDAEQGRHNLACEAFATVRAGNGPLAPYATHAQAEEEVQRGQAAQAIRACEEYRRRWPKGAANEDCLRFVALAQADLGNTAAARAAASAYDEDHPLGKIGEQVSLRIAIGLVGTAPANAIPLLRALAVDHTAPLTGRVAEETLARLREAGFSGATIPGDLDSRLRRAVSLRDSGRRDAAWAAFDALRNDGDPQAQAFVQAEAERFGWLTHRWAFLADFYQHAYETTGDPEEAWSRYKSLVRDGRFTEAADLGLEMLKVGDGHWRKAEDEVARTLMLARRYREARDQFDAAAARGGWSGRRAEVSAAFAAYEGHDLADAIKRYSAIVDDDEAYADEAHYWRARAHDAAGHGPEAAADRKSIVENDPWSWYAALVHRGEPDLPAVAPFARTGRWAGTRTVVGPEPANPPRPITLTVAPPRPIPTESADPSDGFARWRPGTMALLAMPPGAPIPDATPAWELEPPASYRGSELFDPVAGRAALSRFAAAHARRWPELVAASDLVSVGLYDLSGPIVSEWFETWRDLLRHRDREARKLTKVSPEEWRQLFLTARDHHDTARYAYGLWDAQSDRGLALEAWRLDYPLAHDRYVWNHARDRDLDPYLVLGLMRQESTYDATARSRVGARGAMQIMPRTGHLLADLAHDTTFDAGDLEDPTVAVGYGMRYLGLLMERFGGVYPLAVASYNAGPFNVSNWLRATGQDMPLDEMIEHIPYRETRDYVKKVSEFYAAYVALYAPVGAEIVVPSSLAGDRPEVVDF